jgi:hypothetical protein
VFSEALAKEEGSGQRAQSKGLRAKEIKTGALEKGRVGDRENG